MGYQSLIGQNNSLNQQKKEKFNQCSKKCDELRAKGAHVDVMMGGCDCVLCGLVGKPGIIGSKENQTDIYKSPRLYSMNYLKSISDPAQEFT